MKLSPGLIAVVGLATLIATIRCQLVVVTVYGRSMQPSLEPGDRVLVRRSTRLQRQQVAVFTHRSALEDAEPVLLIKRVAAVAGDPIPPSVPAQTTSRIVPTGSVVLLGDNQHHSFDSREIGLVPDTQIVGVVIRRLAHKRSHPPRRWVRPTQQRLSTEMLREPLQTRREDRRRR